MGIQKAYDVGIKFFKDEWKNLNKTYELHHALKGIKGMKFHDYGDFFGIYNDMSGHSRDNGLYLLEKTDTKCEQPVWRYMPDVNSGENEWQYDRQNKKWFKSG